MHLDVNNLGYGNPSQKHLKRAKKGMAFIVPHEPEITPPPQNSSPYVFGELQGLSALGRDYQGAPFLEFVEDADEDLEELYEDFMDEHGIDFEPYYKGLFDDLSVIAIRLKIRFNRMRPFQLANILGVPMYPMNSESAHSPSYPSGHTLQSYVVSEILAEQHPHLAEKARYLAGQIAFSRMVGGWHYPSDNQASIALGDMLLPKIIRPDEVKL